MSGPEKGTGWSAERWDAQRQIVGKATGTLIFKQNVPGASWFGQWDVGGKKVRRKLGDGSLSREEAQERLSDRLPESRPTRPTRNARPSASPRCAAWQG